MSLAHMNRREVTGMTVTPAATLEEGGDSDGPDLRTGPEQINIADIYLEA
jgi:hypothetical protein